MKIIIFYIVLYVRCYACYYIRKCCDRHQQLARNFETCIDFDGNEGIEKYNTENVYNDRAGVNFIRLGTNDTHHIWWLPPRVQFWPTTVEQLSQMDTIEFRYNTKWPCATSSRAIVPFTDYVYILENGDLMITNIDDNIRKNTMVFPPHHYCVDRVSLVIDSKKQQPTHILDHSFAILLCPCIQNPCVRMCCPRKQHTSVTTVPEICEYSPDIPLRWNLTYADYWGKSVKSSEYSVVQNIPNCEFGHYYLNENSSSFKNFWVLPNGNVKIENYPAYVRFEDYCLDNTNLNGTYRQNLRICVNKNLPFRNILYGSFFVIGSISLLLTLVVYGLLRELRTSLHSNYLMFHVACLLVCYVTLTVIEFFEMSIPPNTCVVAAHIVQTSFIAATFWLNVMCIDISGAFRNCRKLNKSINNKINKKTFLKYSSYVWGMTAIIASFTIVADNTNLLNVRFRPGFGIKACWFSDPIPLLIYFYFPVSIALLVNLHLFIYTTRKILKTQRDSRKIINNERNESKKYTGRSIGAKETHRLILYAKLFALMGITWIFEILSFAIGGSDYFWYFTDGLNSLRGVFIFVICCCKKRIFTSITNSLNSFKIKNKVNVTTETNVSITSSTSNNTVTSTIRMVELLQTTCYQYNEIGSD